jgi:hypothetical protein
MGSEESGTYARVYLKLDQLTDECSQQELWELGIAVTTEKRFLSDQP